MEKIKNGFTLIELLAVIVVLAVISVIAIPIIIGTIEKAEKGAFKDSVLNAYNTIEYKLYKMETSVIPEGGIEVNDLNIKENFIDGKFIRNKDNKIVAYYIRTSKYCAYGEINKLLIEKNCDDLDKTSPVVDPSKLAVVTTSKSITTYILDGLAEDPESGIQKYIVNLYKEEEKLETKELTDIGQITFENLTNATLYEIEIIAVNSGKKESEKIKKEATTAFINVPTYNITPTEVSQSKTVTITYPSGYTNEYSVDSGVTWNTYIEPITFTTNGTVISRVNDGINYVTGSSQLILGIDTTSPTSSTFTFNRTSSSITITASGIDDESGISMYQFSKDDGTTWSDAQSNNTYTFSGLTATTYNVKTRVYNNTYGVEGIKNNYLDSSTSNISLVISTVGIGNGAYYNISDYNSVSLSAYAYNGYGHWWENVYKYGDGNYYVFSASATATLCLYNSTSGARTCIVSITASNNSQNTTHVFTSANRTAYDKFYASWSSYTYCCGMQGNIQEVNSYPSAGSSASAIKFQ